MLIQRGLTIFFKMKKKIIKKAIPTFIAQVGDAQVRAQGGFTCEEIMKITDHLAKVNPDAHMVKFSIGPIKVSCDEKNLNRIAVGGIITTIVWFGGKYGFLFLKTKFSNKNEKKHQKSKRKHVPSKSDTLGDLLTKAHTDQPSGYDSAQLIGKLLYEGDRAIVYSQSGVGKSVLCLQMALDISQGKNSLFPTSEANGIQQTPQKVFYFDGEMDKQDYMKIFGKKEASGYSNFVLIRDFYYRNIDEWLEDVRGIVSSNSTSSLTIVLDNITSVCSTVNAETIRELFLLHFKPIQDEAADRGVKITFIVVAHTNKESNLAGSVNLENFATSILRLNRGDDKHVILKVEKNRKYGDMRGKSFRLEKKEDSDGYKHFVILSSHDSKDTAKPDEPATSNDMVATISPPAWEGKISLEKAIEMEKFYQKGVDGHGYEPTRQIFGLSCSREVKKVLKQLEEYQAARKQYEEQQTSSE